MGQCYSVELELFNVARRSAVRALCRYVSDNCLMVDFGVRERKQMGFRFRTVDEYMLMLLADTPETRVTITRDGSTVRYSADFHASYGWEMVLIDAFDAISRACTRVKYKIITDSGVLSCRYDHGIKYDERKNA